MKAFRVRGTDKRRKLVKKTLEKTQRCSGKDVEFFSPETGFILLEKDGKVRYNKAYVQRAIAAAQLSLEPPLELREFYYSTRNTPELAAAFAGVSNLYPAVLDAINKVEILCDVAREDFTIGNLSKGFIYYFHSKRYADKVRKIGFTENIARSAIAGEELEACGNIIIVEKNSAANRLVELGFSELTNSVIATTGGNFNRAVWSLTARFKGDKNVLFMADADAYGVDMLRTIEAGTEASRHLPFKFPPTTNPTIHLTGLFPSIGEMLGLPNDIEQKRPLQNPYVRQRIAFLKTHGLLDELDLETWMHDKTYELEALSIAIKNKQNEPIGLAVYLVEYMRLFAIPVKPPLPPDEELKRLFDKAAVEELMDEIMEAAERTSPKNPLLLMIYEFFEDLEEKLLRVLLERLIPEYLECLEKVTPREIKYHIYKQFEEDPTRATYDLKEIAHKLKTKFHISIYWEADDLIVRVRSELSNYNINRPREEEMAREDVSFQPIRNETAMRTAYDIILDELGCKPEDALKVRAALARRFRKTLHVLRT